MALPVNKKLEELFGLAPVQTEEPVESTELTTITVDQIRQLDLDINKIDAALPMVKNLEATDKEMDDIAELATTTFKDLTELAMSVEPRFSGAILQSASTLLGHAVSARAAKVDAKLKTIDLQLKKMRLDQVALKQAQEDGQGSGGGKTIEGEHYTMDRNELINSILNGSRKT